MRKLIPLRRIEGVAGELSDEALVAACAVGDASSLGALFDRHHAAAYRFLARLATVDAGDLDDLVQATFVEVRRAAAGYAGRAAVRTWIFAIAANVARHHARSEGRRRTLSAEFLRRPHGTPARPDETTERRDLLTRIEKAMQALPHDLRVAFVMCDLEEMRGVEAARALDIREGTLWRRLHEARKALRKALEGEAR